MRLLHVYSGNLFGGIESILVELARGQSAFPNVQHEFALSFHGRLEQELLSVGARVHHLGAVRVSRPTTVRHARAALAHVIESGAFDRVVCHAPWSQGIFGGVVRRTSVPLVFWAHDVMTGRHWSERLAKRVKPDLAICNSRFTTSTLEMLYPNVPSTVVYAPVATTRGGIDPAARHDVRRDFRTTDDAVVIVQASRVERWKGHSVLMDALSRIQHVPRWVWWQVGGAQRPAEAAFLASLKQSAAVLGIQDRVRWVGERDDVPQLLAAADLYCQANLQPEPFGLAFVEALGAGLPVVTVGLGGAREIVDESCGLLVPRDDPGALANALQTIVEDDRLRARLGDAAPARARNLCDPASSRQRLADALAAMAREEVRA
jgi:glycosyltransferase involved in cell wall biosynthesis